MSSSDTINKQIQELTNPNNKINLREFIKLTTIGVGTYGIYRISEEGVTVIDVPHEYFNANNQKDYQTAKKDFSLVFPCSAEEFVQWYDRTRGTDAKDESGGFVKSASDFPATQFLDKLAKAIKREGGLDYVELGSRLSLAFDP